jgi:hypothetical protein
VAGGVGTAREAEAGRERKTKVKKGELIGRVLPSWPHEAMAEGGKALGRQGSGCGPATVGTGGAMVRTGQLTGGPQRFRIFPNYPNWLKLGN